MKYLYLGDDKKVQYKNYKSLRSEVKKLQLDLEITMNSKSGLPLNKIVCEKQCET